MYIVSQKYVTVYTDVDMDETGSVVALPFEVKSVRALIYERHSAPEIF